MTPEPKKQYTVEFKREVVPLVTEQGYPLSGTTRNLRINRDMLRRKKGTDLIFVGFQQTRRSTQPKNILSTFYPRWT